MSIKYLIRIGIEVGTGTIFVFFCVALGAQVYYKSFVLVTHERILNNVPTNIDTNVDLSGTIFEDRGYIILYKNKQQQQKKNIKTDTTLGSDGLNQVNLSMDYGQDKTDISRNKSDQILALDWLVFLSQCVCVCVCTRVDMPPPRIGLLLPNHSQTHSVPNGSVG